MYLTFDYLNKGVGAYSDDTGRVRQIGSLRLFCSIELYTIGRQTIDSMTLL